MDLQRDGDGWDVMTVLMVPSNLLLLFSNDMGSSSGGGDDDGDGASGCSYSTVGDSSSY